MDLFSTRNTGQMLWRPYPTMRTWQMPYWHQYNSIRRNRTDGANNFDFQFLRYLQLSPSGFEWE